MFDNQCTGNRRACLPRALLTGLLLIALGIGTASALTWEITTAESTGATGSCPSLALDDAGFPRICYGDQTNTNDELKYAAYDGSTWRIPSVDSQEHKYETSLELESAGNPQIAPPNISHLDTRNLNFAAAASPEITSIAPNISARGATVSATITGTGFADPPTVELWRAVPLPGGLLIFVTIPATDVAVQSPTQLTCSFELPATAYIGTYAVIVTNPDDQSGTLSNGFTVTFAPPTVTAIAPNSSAQGTTVAITNLAGTEFQSGATVTLTRSGSVDITATNVDVVSSTNITCRVALPSTAAPGAWNVVVTNPDGQSGTLTNGFTVLAPAPTITSIAPNISARGATVSATITGTGFADPATVELWKAVPLPGGLLIFVTIPATDVAVQSPTQITCSFELPASAHIGTYAVIVTNPDDQSGTLSNGFNVTSAPLTLASITPNSGTQGTTVAITNLAGTGFVNGATVRLQKFGYDDIVAASPTVVSPTQITCQFPLPSTAAPGGWGVVVTNPDTTNATLINGFTVHTPLTVTAIAPNRSGQGTTVAITDLAGTGFAEGATVKLTRAGSTDIAATDVSVISGTKITCTFAVPRTAAVGSWNVVVTSYDGRTGTLPDGFTVVGPPPTVAAIAPNAGARGTTVSTTITGTSFAAPATVKLSRILSLMPPRIEVITATNATVESATQITCTVAVPSTALIGTYDVVVTNPDTQSGILSNGFTVPAPPTVAAIAPNTSSRGATVSATITGTDFAAPATARLWKIISVFPMRMEIITATDVVMQSPTQITCTFAVPATALIGTYDVVVTNPDTQVGTLSGAFTVLDVPTVTGISPNRTALFDPLSEVFVSGTNFVPDAQVSLRRGDTVIEATDETRINATTIRCAVEIPWNAPVGTYNVSVENPGAPRVEKAAAFTVIASTPYVTSVQPNQEYPGATVSIHVDGTNFMTGTEIEMRGGPGGETVIETDESWNYPDLTVVLTIPSTAPPGAYTVVARNPGGTWFTTGVTFTVLEPPTVTGISPNRAALFDILTEVYVTGTNFVSGAQVSIRGGDTVIEATDETRINATTVRCAVEIPWVTPLGTYGVYVTNPGAARVGKENAFAVIAPTPYVTGITPSREFVGTTVGFLVDGSNFMTGTEIAIKGGPGGTTVIEATGETWNYPELTGTLALPSTVPAGAYTVLARNPGTEWFETGVTFTVLGLPTVTGISPNSAALGETLSTVYVSGSNFTSGAQVSIRGGTVIDATGEAVINATTIRCALDIPWFAPIGTYGVYVSASGSAWIGREAAFTVVAPTPYVTSVQPNQEYLGATVLVQVDGSNFMTGTEFGIKGGPGGTTVIEATDEAWNYPELTGVLAIPSSAPAGTYTVIVRNPGTEWFETGIPFTALEPPTVTGISPNTGSQGSMVVITNLAGTGFRAGATVRLQRSGSADLPAIDVVAASLSRITCRIPLPANASIGAWNVVVTLPGGRSATLTSGFTVTAGVPAVAAVPTSTLAPTDPDGDGTYEDVNGNKRPDFADVVLYFTQMTWIAGNEPVSAFDYNANGRIDFADVVWLFNHL